VKKVTLFKEPKENFFSNNGMEAIPIFDLYPVAKKNIEEISLGTLNFYKCQLGCDFQPRGSFKLDEHGKNITHITRAVAYAVWFIAACFATRARLNPSGNFSCFLQYTFFSENSERYRKFNC
jgi:hypothetical protein